MSRKEGEPTGRDGLAARVPLVAALLTSVACASPATRVETPAPGADSAESRGARGATSKGGTASEARSVFVVRVSPNAARVPGLIENGLPSGQVSVTRDGAELPRLEQLHDDDAATGVYSAERPGVSISGGAGRLELVGRLTDWAHGGEVRDPPPLTAVRVASFEGLEPALVAAVVNLAVTEILFAEEQGQGGSPSSASRLKLALERATAALEDPRARPDCRAPCRPLPWQTAWSVLTTSARAKWLLGARLEDAALLAQSAELAQRALRVVPEQTHSLTLAVSQRLLGAVLHSVGDLTDDDAVLTKSLSATESALSAFRPEKYRYDWALTQTNLQKTLSVRAERSSSPGALAAAFAASEQALAVFGEQTPNLEVQALLKRTELLQSRRARSSNQRDLIEALRLTEHASTRGATAQTLLVAVTLRRCDLESELANLLDDREKLRQAVTRCEQLLNGPALPETSEPEARRSYGLALGRLASELGDATMMARAVEQLERAIEAADRVEGKRAGIKTKADYAWALVELARLTASVEAARKAVSVIGKTLEPVSKRAAPVTFGQLKQLQGAALMALGMKLRGAFQLPLAIELYEQARGAFVEALGTFEKDDNPKRWAALQGRIGSTFAWQGEIDERQQRRLLNEAVASYQRALGVADRRDDPEGFGEAQLGLGSAYLILADQAGSRATVRASAQRAGAAFRAALEAFQRAGKTKSIANAQAHLAEALEELGRSTGAPVCEAITLRLEAVAAYPHAHGPWETAREALARYERAPAARKRCPTLPVKPSPTEQP